MEPCGVEPDGYFIKDGVAVIMIIGEIEGHENTGDSIKTTRYDHLIPLMVNLSMDPQIRGFLFLIHTIGGDVSCGLALAETMASLRQPCVSLVMGDSHSIGVPLAVAVDYSFIVPSATVLLHPVRMAGTILASSQTACQFEQIQNRILSFIETHTNASRDSLKKMMNETTMIPKDLGTILVGEEAVKKGLICATGRLWDAIDKLTEMLV